MYAALYVLNRFTNCSRHFELSVIFIAPTLHPAYRKTSRVRTNQRRSFLPARSVPRVNREFPVKVERGFTCQTDNIGNESAGIRLKPTCKAKGNAPRAKTASGSLDSGIKSSRYVYPGQSMDNANDRTLSFELNEDNSFVQYLK